ncbi:MAG: hypothetical protein P9F75_20825 [Candidatus Contendobacter sp.]|nr:hypothetical protein [Candidatus Contendobacter sp.]
MNAIHQARTRGFQMGRLSQEIGLVLFLCGALLTLPAFGQSRSVYRCPQPDGGIQFQESACADSAGKEVTVDIGDTGNGRLRSGEVRVLLETGGGHRFFQRWIEKDRTEWELRHSGNDQEKSQTERELRDNSQPPNPRSLSSRHWLYL